RIQVTDRYHVARRIDQHVFGDRSRSAETGRDDVQFRSSRTVVLHALRAVPALTAAPRAVDDHGSSDLQPSYAVTERGDPPGPFVTERQRQAECVLLLGQSHDDCIGVTHPGGGDLEEDLSGS